MIFDRGGVEDFVAVSDHGADFPGLMGIAGGKDQAGERLHGASLNAEINIGEVF